MSKIQSLITSAIIFLFPLFFLTTTQEFFVINKFYFLAGGVLVLLALGAINLVFDKNIHIRKSHFDIPVILFVLFYAISVILVSPNKIEAAFTPGNGFVSILFIALFYFILSQESHKNAGEKHNHLGILNLSAAFLGLITIFF